MYSILKILIIIIIVFIFSQLFVNYEENSEKSHHIYYRLGDMFKEEGTGYPSRHNKKIGFNYHVKHFPNSIATEYMLATNKSGDYDQLIKIINKRKPIIKLDNYITIHLRIGDVIEDSDKSLDEILHKYTIFNKRNYVKPIDYYDKIINKIKNYNIKNVILIGGFHKKGNHQKSIDYVNYIQKYFISKGYNCSKRIDNEPDDDFLIMCNSKYFVPSGGGFSNIIKNIVNIKGGTVIEI